MISSKTSNTMKNNNLENIPKAQNGKVLVSPLNDKQTPSFDWLKKWLHPEAPGFSEEAIGTEFDKKVAAGQIRPANPERLASLRAGYIKNARNNYVNKYGPIPEASPVVEQEPVVMPWSIKDASGNAVSLNPNLSSVVAAPVVEAAPSPSIETVPMKEETTTTTVVTRPAQKQASKQASKTSPSQEKAAPAPVVESAPVVEAAPVDNSYANLINSLRGDFSSKIAAARKPFDEAVAKFDQEPSMENIPMSKREQIRSIRRNARQDIKAVRGK